MRELKSHIVNPANDKLRIQVIDQPGAGGAHHHYVIDGYKAENGGVAIPTSTFIAFQNGAIPEAGVNGLTQEALLAILIDRLRCFQAGPFSCRENAIALTKLEEAQMWLLQRTRNRMDRGVEGTHQK